MMTTITQPYTHSMQQNPSSHSASPMAMPPPGSQPGVPQSHGNPQMPPTSMGPQQIHYMQQQQAAAQAAAVAASQGGNPAIGPGAITNQQHAIAHLHPQMQMQQHAVSQQLLFQQQQNHNNQQRLIHQMQQSGIPPGAIQQQIHMQQQREAQIRNMQAAQGMGFPPPGHPQMRSVTSLPANIQHQLQAQAMQQQQRAQHDAQQQQLHQAQMVAQQQQMQQAQLAAQAAASGGMSGGPTPALMGVAQPGQPGMPGGPGGVPGVPGHPGQFAQGNAAAMAAVAAQAQAQAQAQQQQQPGQPPNTNLQQHPGQQPGQPGQPGLNVPGQNQMNLAQMQAVRAQQAAAHAQQQAAQAQNQSQVQAQAQAAALAHQKAAATAAGSPAGTSTTGQAILKLYQFAENLSQFDTSGRSNDMNHWRQFVTQFYSPSGVMRQMLWNSHLKETKQFEITNTVLARYYYTVFESGVRNIQLLLENAREKEMPGLGGSMVESTRTSFIHWFSNGCQVVSTGTLRANLNAQQQIEMLEFSTAEHVEYVPRSSINIGLPSPATTDSPPELKTSPRGKKRALKQSHAPQRPPPPAPMQQFSMPESPINQYGVSVPVMRCLEIAETLTQMRDLFQYSQSNQHLGPKQALETFVQQMQNAQAQQQGRTNSNPGSGVGTPQTMNAPLPPQTGQQSTNGMLGLGASPAALGASPHMMATPSPAQTHLQAPGLMAQGSQQGQTPTPSTSPNATKRRRASQGGAVKVEDDGGGPEVNGINPKVKQSPRVPNRKKQGAAA